MESKTEHTSNPPSASSGGSANEGKLRAENARLKELLKQADWLIIEHHSSTIMREQYNVCPICAGDGNRVLREIGKQVRADAGNSPNDVRSAISTGNGGR